MLRSHVLSRVLGSCVENVPSAGEMSDLSREIELKRQSVSERGARERHEITEFQHG